MIRLVVSLGLIRITSCKSQPNNQSVQTVKSTTQPQPATSSIATNTPDSLMPEFGKYGYTSTKYSGGFYEYCCTANCGIFSWLLSIFSAYGF